MGCCWFRTFVCAVVVVVVVWECDLVALFSLCKMKKLGFNLCHLSFILVFLIFVNINVLSKTKGIHSLAIGLSNKQPKS